MSLRVLNAATATSAVPTLATDGFALVGNSPGSAGFWQKYWDAGAIHLKGAGTGALTIQCVVHLYSVLTAVWAPAGISATIANRGMLNDGTTITGTTTLAHTQPIAGLSCYERIYFQITTLTGTGMTVSAFLSPRFMGA